MPSGPLDALPLKTTVIRSLGHMRKELQHHKGLRPYARLGASNTAEMCPFLHGTQLGCPHLSASCSQCQMFLFTDLWTPLRDVSAVHADKRRHSSVSACSPENSAQNRALRSSFLLPTFRCNLRNSGHNKKPRDLSPRTNYTDGATAACR
jgi:hypothetical protein